VTVLDLTYVTEKTCPICKGIFPATRVRSRLRTLRQDTDFNVVYEQINPIYYSIWFCPHCGYAASDSAFADILERQVEPLQKFLADCQVKIDFSGLRSREQAILLYKLAIYYSELLDMKKSRLGGLYLRLAWLYREAEDEGMELLAMEKALENYEAATYKENFPIGNMNEITVYYLIAQLQYRTGDLDKAAASFSRIIASPQAKAEKRISEMSRDAWNEIKILRKERTESPE
jgi:uncharacterized protein (DUF2225 family)